MKLRTFDFNESYGESGHMIRLTEKGGVDISLRDFRPSLELIAAIEKEAAAEIYRRRATHDQA